MHSRLDKSSLLEGRPSTLMSLRVAGQSDILGDHLDCHFITYWIPDNAATLTLPKK